MEKNIFEGAKFGDKFVTRDGKIGRLWKNKITTISLVFDEFDYVIKYNAGGKWEANPDEENGLDIVARYPKTLSEEELEMLAEETFAPFIGDSDTIPFNTGLMIAGFKICYRKMMEK